MNETFESVLFFLGRYMKRFRIGIAFFFYCLLWNWNIDLNQRPKGIWVLEFALVIFEFFLGTAHCEGKTELGPVICTWHWPLLSLSLSVYLSLVQVLFLPFDGLFLYWFLVRFCVASARFSLFKRKSTSEKGEKKAKEHMSSKRRRTTEQETFVLT